MWNWVATSRNELHQWLRAIPPSALPHGNECTTQQVENWVLRHLLWTVASATSLLAYPLSAHKGERPDLDLQSQNESIGIEVTQAIPPSYAQAIAIQRQYYPTKILDPSLFEWGTPPRATREIHELLQRQGNSLSGPGWQGESPQQEWASRMAGALIFKTDKLNEPTFRRQRLNWLAIYDNTPRPPFDISVATKYLKERFDVVLHDGVRFDRIFVELADEIVMVNAGEITRLRLTRP